MKLFEDHLASSFYVFLNDNYQGSKQRPANGQMAGQILQPNFCTRSLHGLLQTWDYLGIMAPNSWYISFYHYLSFKQWNYLCIWREAKYKPITEVFNSKSLQSHLSPVGSWRLGTRCDSQIWNIKSWVVFCRLSRAGGNNDCYVDLIYIFFLLWGEQVDNLCGIDSTWSIFDFIYKFALNHSSFTDYAVCVCNVILNLVYILCCMRSSAHFLWKSSKVSLAEFNRV